MPADRHRAEREATARPVEATVFGRVLLQARVAGIRHGDIDALAWTRLGHVHLVAQARSHPDGLAAA